MKKGISILSSLAIALSFGNCVANAEVSSDIANEEMYATGFSVGNPLEVNTSNKVRLNPKNALGKPDAVQIGGDDKFYGVASHNYTTYTFDKEFFNTDNKDGDILMSEVTWGTYYVEAVKVYLKDAYVKDDSGNIVPYKNNDDGHGYYVGIAWNKIGQAVDDKTKSDIESKGYENRKFIKNSYTKDGNIQWTGINIPEEVVYASGVTVVDITQSVRDIAKGLSCYRDSRSSFDGYDLDAIRVYTADPMISFEDSGRDSATGLGDELPNGKNWFMYNAYDSTKGDVQTFEIQAGNPKNKEKIIGYYTVTNNGDGSYTAKYNINDTIEINGKIYKIKVENPRLGISDDASAFKGAPGQDCKLKFDNNGKVTFKDKDGVFNIFAHFDVQYKAYINYVNN